MKNKHLDIIFENKDFIAVNKSPGMLSVPDRQGKETSLKQMLQQQYEEIFIVHRLDKETSGVIVFAKNAVTHKLLCGQFEHRKIEKYYVGLVMGNPINSIGRIDIGIAEHPIKKGEMITHAKGKESLTTYEVLQNFRNYSWLKFRIHTGRTHQIRVHTKHIGHPLVCDELYGDGKPVFVSQIKKNFKLSKNVLDEIPILQRLALHAYQLKFSWNNKDIDLIAEPPKDIRALLIQLEKNNK